MPDPDGAAREPDAGASGGAAETAPDVAGAATADGEPLTEEALAAVPDAVVPELAIPDADLSDVDVTAPDIPEAVIPESLLAEPVIPPPPAETVTRPRRRESRPAGEFAPAPPAAAAASTAAPASATAADSVPQPAVVPPAAGASRGYTGWTIAVYSILAVLLIGAVGLIGVLVSGGVSPFPASAPESRSPAPSESATAGGVAPRDEPSTDADRPVTVGCEQLCGQLTDLVGEQVSGADGTPWVRSWGWGTLALPQQGSEETIAAEYTSDAGALMLTVRGYESDAAAEAALEGIRAERGEPDRRSSVYDDGTGVTYYYGGGTPTVLWFVEGRDRPWVLQLEGASAEALWHFYLALAV